MFLPLSLIILVQFIALMLKLTATQILNSNLLYIVCLYKTKWVLVVLL